MKTVKNFKAIRSLTSVKVCSGKLNGKVIFDAYKKDGEEIPSNTFVSNISSVVPQRKRRPDEKLVESYLKFGYKFSLQRKSEIDANKSKKISPFISNYGNFNQNIKESEITLENLINNYQLNTKNKEGIVNL